MTNLDTDAQGVKHTPGPWLIEDDHIVSQDPEANGFYSIARLAGEDRFANARLIAAAPDMLAALRGAALYIECLAKNPEDFTFANYLKGIVAKTEGR